MRLLPLICAPGLLLAGLAMPVTAETLEELDALAELTATEAGGIAAAREAAGRGEFLDALAMLERVLGASPRSAEALLLHAQYLCAIDDRQGGLIELRLLRPRDYQDNALEDVRLFCEGA